MTVDLQRRRVFQSAVAGGALSLGAFVPTPVSAAVARAAADIEVMTWSGCAVNCGSRCQLRVFSKNGRVIRIETDASGDASASTIDGGCTQIRACQRGRSMRQRIYAPERLKFPMKRVGRRGEGRFERISWEQALDEIAARLKDTIDRHTNESVMIMHGSGNQALVNSSAATYRFFNMIGGSLAWYSDYSTACIQNAWPYLYGRFDYGGVRSKAAGQGSYFSQVKNAKLYVTFGNNPAVTRASGGGQSWEFFSAARRNGTRMVFIDPIYSDTMAGRNAEWIPIRPGTDAALCEAIAYVLITENLVDKAFIDRYTIGYDEDSLPASAKPGSSYRSHILGLGPDKTPKTPERAAGITNVPAERIVRLARDMAAAKPCFISQGWAPQRRMNGETQSTSIAMLPILLGQIGLPGTNSGAREGDSYGLEAGLPTGANPVKVGMPVFLWPQAVVDAASLTAETAAVRGAPALRHNIKFIWNTQSNTLINQHSDSNRTDEILRDTSKCEFIVVCDNMMTPWARYADILLPDTLGPEADDVTASGGSNGDSAAILPLHKAVEPQWEQRPTREICRGIARHLGKEEAFTEGKTQLEWIEWCYNETRRKIPSLPDFATFWKTGPAHIHDLPNAGIALEAFRKDPKANPLKTPSGRIEIYSERLANIAKNWVLPKGDVISPIPMFVRTWEMPGDALQKKYPLQCYGYHGHGRIHSTFHNLPALREQFPDEVLVNVLDADARSIRSGDRVRVFNDRGAVELVAKVTPRIIPGVVSIPQGAWYRPVMKDGRRVDVGGNINTLTSLRPSPLAKGNPQHTNLVEVVKA